MAPLSSGRMWLVPSSLPHEYDTIPEMGLPYQNRNCTRTDMYLFATRYVAFSHRQDLRFRLESTPAFSVVHRARAGAATSDGRAIPTTAATKRSGGSSGRSGSCNDQPRGTLLGSGTTCNGRSYHRRPVTPPDAHVVKPSAGSRAVGGGGGGTSNGGKVNVGAVGVVCVDVVCPYTRALVSEGLARRQGAWTITTNRYIFLLLLE